MASFNGDAQQILHELEKLVSRLQTSEDGFTLSGVEFSSNLRSGVGVFAKESVTKGSVLVQIPYRLCLSVDAVVSTPSLKRIFEEQEQLLSFPDEVLAVGLMFGAICAREHTSAPASRAEELESMCPWLQHVKTLPVLFNTTLFWSDVELGQLKGCTTFHLTQLMRRTIDSDWNSVHEKLVEAYPELLGGATKADYMWALSIIYSRAVGFTRRGSAIRCIPPVLDMANHDPHAAAEAADTFAFDDELDVVRLVAAQDTAAGEECTAVYGRYPNSKLAYTYGFVVHSNPHTAIDLWARVPSTSFMAEQKRQLLESNALTAQQSYDFSGTLRSGGWVSPALLATIRVIQMSSDDEFEQADKAFRGEMVSLRNEAACYSSLKALLTSRMAVESAEADRTRLGELLLAEGGGVGSEAEQSREFMALVICVEERELVRECLGAVGRWVAALESSGDGEYIPPDAPK